MNLDRIRLTVEVLGITALVLSLMFVGFELKQTRDMNLAKLKHDRYLLFHNNMMAVLESESALAFHSKYVYTKKKGVTWNPAELTEFERTAGLIHTEARLAAWAMDYDYIEQGFSVRTFDDLESEIRNNVTQNGPIRGVYPLWMYPGHEVHGFSGMMHRVLSIPDTR